MRTRSQDRATSLIPAEDIKQEVQNKRRASSPTHEGQYNADDEDEAGKATATPQKKVKRVRFSDLGPEIQGTGLTPMVRRTTLSPSVTAPRTTPRPRGRRRASLPARLASPSSPATPVQEVQFTPMRQMLHDRVRRRLRRSHLSAELNDIESEMRATANAQQELTRLRGEGAQKEQRINELTWDLELQRQLGISVNDEEEQMVQDLRDELERLKERMVNEHGEGHDAMPSPRTNDGRLHVIAEEGVPTSPWEEETFFSSPTKHGQGLPSPSRTRQLSPSKRSVADSSAQACMSEEAHEKEFQALEASIAELTKENADAKATIEGIRQELTRLGFPSEGSDDILATLRNSIRTVRLSLEHLVPGETPGSADDGRRLLRSLLEHIKRLVVRGRERERKLASHCQSESALRGQFNATLARVADLEQRISVIEAHRTELIRELEDRQQEVQKLQEEAASGTAEAGERSRRVTELEAESTERSTSVERLTSALGTYREEIASLEKLITSMEKESTAKDAELADARKKVEEFKSEHERSQEALTKLREDVQTAAFDLSALAKPEIKDNVTFRGKSARRAVHPTEPSEHPSEHGTQKTRKESAKKRDSGISISDDVSVAS